MVAVTISSSESDVIEPTSWKQSIGARLDAPIAVLDQGLVSGVNFLTAQMLIAWGSREAGGAYALAWVIVLFTRSTVINLAATPYTMRRGRGEGEFAGYAASSFTLQLAISLAAAALLAIVGMVFHWTMPGAPASFSLGYTFLAAAAVIPFVMAREYARQISFAHAAPIAALAMDTVAGAVQLGILYVSFHWFVGAPTAYLASGAAAILGIAVWWAFGLQRMNLNARRMREDWTYNWQFGRWALVSQITGNLAPLPWIIFAIWGAGETGAFDGANRIVGLSNILVIGYCNFLAAAAANAFAGEGASGLSRVVLRAVVIFTTGLGGLCLLAHLWGGDVLTLVMRGKVENSGGIVAVLALATLIDGLNQIATLGLRAMQRPSDAVLPDICEVLVTLGFAIPLVWCFSAPGAAWAMVFGRLAGLLLRWKTYLYRMRRLPLTPPQQSAAH